MSIIAADLIKEMFFEHPEEAMSKGHGARKLQQVANGSVLRHLAALVW